MIRFTHGLRTGAFLAGALALTTLTAGSALAEWHSDYHVAKRASVTAGKRLLVVLEQPTDPTHSIEQVSTMNGSVEKELLNPYTTVRVDVTTEKGKKLAEAFKATEFPYTAVIDKEGKWVVYENTGRYTNSQWITMLVSNEKEKPAELTSSRADHCFT